MARKFDESLVSDAREELHRYLGDTGRGLSNTAAAALFIGKFGYRGILTLTDGHRLLIAVRNDIANRAMERRNNA